MELCIGRISSAPAGFVDAGRILNKPIYGFKQKLIKSNQKFGKGFIQKLPELNGCCGWRHLDKWLCQQKAERNRGSQSKIKVYRYSQGLRVETLQSENKEWCFFFFFLIADCIPNGLFGWRVEKGEVEQSWLKIS